MAVVNPDHLLEQAARLASPPQVGGPRQADLRRAVSTAYYALFHFIPTSLGDEMVGVTKRSTVPYALIYRRPDHGVIKAICSEVKKPTPPPKIAAVAPANGFGKDEATFASLFCELQEKRHRADYDPLAHFKSSDAQLAISAARRAIARFRNDGATRRKTFLTLLLCPPR